jgi:alpha-ketoglutarate-dependent taurine dioxygenase
MILERLRPSHPSNVRHRIRPDSASAWAADPRLRDAREIVRERGWAVLRGLPVTGEARADEATALAIAAAFGEPSSRDGGDPVRRVTPAPRGAGTTFSSWSGAAGLHTDSQYHRVPEPLVCMFMVRPAARGGLTRLLSARDAVDALADRPDGDELLGLLAQPVWRWRVPAEFASTRLTAPAAKDRVAGHVFRPVTRSTAAIKARSTSKSPEFAADRRRPEDSPPAAVLGADGTVRWRGDNLAPGLPAAQTAAARVVDRCFDAAAGVVTLRLHAGDLVVADNRRVLHGRTRFVDSRRLLLRVRLWESA